LIDDHARLTNAACGKIGASMFSVPFIQSLTRFGIVGILAGLTQSSIFYALAKYTSLSGFVANTLAFIFALVISYFGQSRWTFADRTKRSIPRFLTIALASFTISSGGAWIVVDRWRFSPIWMVPIILIVIPATSFVLMRVWAFTR
jgi:putative flippase GtrA